MHRVFTLKMSIIELQDESLLNKKQFKFVFFSTLNQTHIMVKNLFQPFDLFTFFDVCASGFE